MANKTPYQRWREDEHRFLSSEQVERYVKTAARLHHDEGNIEVDENAVVSHSSGNGGAYVLAWVWVPDDALDKT